MSTLLSPTLDVYLAVSLTLGVTWLYFTFKQPEDVQDQPPQKETKTSIFLLLHTLFTLYSILVARPDNLFELFKLPINTPPDTIKALLIQQSDTGNIPSHLDLLLKRLSSFDMRILYVRFGHHTIANCDFCISYEDFALFTLPSTLLSYTFEVGVIGLLTLRSSNRNYLRPLGIGALVIACLAEFYYITTSPVIIPQPGDDEPTYMLHDKLYRMRQLLFLILPLIIYKIPTIPIPIPILSNLLSPPVVLTPEQKQYHLSTTLRTLEHLLPNLHLSKYTRSSIMRTPELREQANKWWDEEEKEGRWILEDENMKTLAKASGLGISKGQSGTGNDDEPLRKSAAVAVGSIQSAVVPSEHWS